MWNKILNLFDKLLVNLLFYLKGKSDEQNKQKDKIIKSINKKIEIRKKLKSKKYRDEIDKIFKRKP